MTKKKFTKKYIEMKRRELKRKQKIRRVICGTVATVATVAVVATVGIKSIESIRWAKENPEAYEYIIQNKLEWVTPEQRLELEKRFGGK